MKAQLTKQFTVKSIIDTPLYGFNIEKLFNEKYKHVIKELIVEAIEKELSIIEVQVEGVTLSVEVTYDIKSISPKKYGDII